MGGFTRNNNESNNKKNENQSNNNKDSTGNGKAVVVNNNDNNKMTSWTKTARSKKDQVSESVASENTTEKGGLEPFTDGDERLIDMIESDIIDRDLGVSWSSIAKLDEAKRLLKEVYSMLQASTCVSLYILNPNP